MTFFGGAGFTLFFPGTPDSLFAGRAAMWTGLGDVGRQHDAGCRVVGDVGLDLELVTQALLRGRGRVQVFGILAGESTLGLGIRA